MCVHLKGRKEAEYLLFFLCSLYFLSAFLSSPIPPSELTQCAMDDQEQHRQPQPNSNNGSNADPFLLNYSTSDLRTASEFLATWLPFLSRDLCTRCTLSLSDRIRSIDPGRNTLTFLRNSRFFHLGINVFLLTPFRSFGFR